MAALTRIQAASRVDHGQTVADLMQQARAMRRMWQAALIEILRDIGDEAAARRYLESRDGRMVLTLAGYETDVSLREFSLQPIADRADAHREASAPARQARKVALAAGQYRDAAGRVREGEAVTDKPAACQRAVDAKTRIFAAADAAHAAGHVVTAGRLARRLPGIPTNTVAGGLTAWRKARGLSARG